MRRYIYLLLACGLFDISVRINAASSGSGTVNTANSQKDEENAKKYENSFIAFIKENKEEYKYLFKNELISNIFDISISDDRFDFQDIEIDFSDISAMINNWINFFISNEKSSSKAKELEKLSKGKELFFKEMSERRNKEQNWRIHGWVFAFDKEQNKFFINKKLSESKADDKFKFTSASQAKKSSLIQGIMSDNHKDKGDFKQNINELIKENPSITDIVLFLKDEKRSLPIWKIRHIIFNSFKDAFSQDSTPTEQIPPTTPKRGWFKSLS